MDNRDQELVRIARQHAETTRLLGVDFLPRMHAPSARVEASRPGPSSRTRNDEPDAPGAHQAVATQHAAPARDKRAALEALLERYKRESKVAKAMPGWTKVVFGDGSPDARLMFVGEAPGADEDAQGVPFVGRAGQKLNDMIRAMGLKREEVYIANVLKVRPPNNRTPTPEEAALDGPFLDEQIRIIAPEVICTLGRPAAHYLLNTTDAMGALRGRWFEYHGVPVMPTFHPAYLLRSYTPEVRGKVWSDLQKIMERLGLSKAQSAP